MKEVAIIGFGLHPWGKFPDMSWDDLAVYAAEKALKDANVEWKDIQMICGGEDRFSGNQGILAGSTLHARLGPTGIPTVNVLQRLCHRWLCSQDRSILYQLRFL